MRQYAADIPVAQSGVNRVDAPANGRYAVAPMKIVAHRGASHEAPENTVAAVHLAWQERADAVEIDVRLSLDGHVVVIHDESTQRTTGKHLLVRDQVWDVLRALDAGSWKSPRWRHVSMPLFRDILKILPSGRTLFAELKAGSDLVPALQGDLEIARPAPESLIFLGFNGAILRELKRAAPTFRAYLNVEPRGQRGAPVKWTAADLVDLVRNQGLDGLSVGWCDAVDDAFVQDVLARRMDLVVWAVDDEHVALRLARAGLPWLMTNKPSFIRHRLQQHGER